jgi:GGDEF domain-containing protein
MDSINGDANYLIKQADIAMYQTKQTGGNHIRFYLDKTL